MSATVTMTSTNSEVHLTTEGQPSVRPRVADTFMDGLSTLDGTGITIGRSAPMPGIPTFTDPYEHRRWALERMAGAFRVMARKDYLEGTAGHISLRDPVDPHTFWINP